MTHQGDTAFRPLCERLHAEFDAGYQFWVRVEDYQRWIDAGVLNVAKNVAGTIPLIERGVTIRKALTPVDIAPFVPV